MPTKERRHWARLSLAIPVFVRGINRQGTEFLEFSTLLNESGGGALLLIRRSLRLSSRVSLEIPSSQIPSNRAKRAPWFKVRRGMAVGVAAVMVIACWIVFRDRRSALTSGLSVPQGSNALEPQRPVAPAKRVLAKRYLQGANRTGSRSVGEEDFQIHAASRGEPKHPSPVLLGRRDGALFHSRAPVSPPLRPAGSAAQPVTR